MAWIAAYLPADQALAIWNDLTVTARRLQGPTEPRTLTQLRPDILTRRLFTNRGAIAPDPTDTGYVSGDVPVTKDAPEDMIGLATLVCSDEPATGLGINDNPGTHGNRAPAEPDPTAPGTSEGTPNPALDKDAAKVPTPRADVLVTVPFFALLGLTDEPAVLDGYGPIPASMARQLLAKGAESFRRVLLDPSDGTPLEIGRTSYRLTKAMRKALHLRDGKCAFPGCSNNALDNEIDQLKAWQHGGTTGISNLAQLCPKHHRLKHNSGWEPTSTTNDKPPGWTSPTGQQYQAEQPDHEPPQWPPGILPLEINPAQISPTKFSGSKISASETPSPQISALEGLLLQLLSG